MSTTPQVEMKNIFDELALKVIRHEVKDVNSYSILPESIRTVTETKDLLHGLMTMRDYPTRQVDDEGYFYCPFCNEEGDFPTGNSGIDHLATCPVTLATRLYPTYYNDEVTA